MQKTLLTTWEGGKRGGALVTFLFFLMMFRICKKIIKLEREVYCQLYNGGGESGRNCSRKKGKKIYTRLNSWGRGEVAKEGGKEYQRKRKIVKMRKSRKKRK